MSDCERLRVTLVELVAKWRQEARADAISGVGHSLLKDDREYYGAVNAALAIAQCADDLEAAITPGPKEPR